jgi:antibiotic biosynthesis monooxygenase (ABM) superfamily enzyme
MNQSPKWKFAIMVWLAIYPAITLLSYLIGDHIKNLPLPIKTLIMTGILVPLMVFVLLPLLRKVIGNWLNK